jgi:hypothetical protein
VVEEGSDVSAPVQEEFEEDPRKKVEGYFHAKLHWEEQEVVVKQQKSLAWLGTTVLMA